MQAPTDNLSHDPIHGYIPFSADLGKVDSTAADTDGGLRGGNADGQEEVVERQIIDHPWVQRMRQIHQLQTAWWVYPTAEHTRFQHILGAMHLASRTIGGLYESLGEAVLQHGETCPSRGYVECTLRLAGLLHDVGHGPFGHFFDSHFLTQFGLTHETLGAHIIEHELGDLVRRVRRNPNSRLEAHEQLDPAEIAWLIQRPRDGEDLEMRPRWLVLLRSLLSGIYTIDNMDFVLRDAYMSGFSPKSFDLDRLLYYSFFTPSGLTIARRGVGSLLRFMAARSELFDNVYFHRTVRAIDLALADVFAASGPYLFPGNPLEHLEAYREFTETSLLVDVPRWRASADPQQAALGRDWQALFERRIPWRMACQRKLLFSESDAEASSVFSDGTLLEAKLRQSLPADLADIPLKVDIARHIYRPHAQVPAAHQNFFADGATGQVRPLTDNLLFRHLPVSSRICRVYTQTPDADKAIGQVLDELTGAGGPDDLTNM